ncbi:hypothetical protein [Streptomyces sp. NPDC002758]
MARLAKRPLIDHKQAAANCRRQPGTWKVIGEYRSSTSADGTAYAIRAAYQHTAHLASPYAPAGAFEARTVLTQEGVNVIARYVGVSDDVAWSDAVAELIGGAA